MTVIGSGNANSASRSTGPWVGIPARRSSAIWAIRGCKAVTDRGVKACATSRRKRVWSGVGVEHVGCHVRAQRPRQTQLWMGRVDYPAEVVDVLADRRVAQYLLREVVIGDEPAGKAGRETHMVHRPPAP